MVRVFGIDLEGKKMNTLKKMRNLTKEEKSLLVVWVRFFKATDEVDFMDFMDNEVITNILCFDMEKLNAVFESLFEKKYIEVVSSGKKIVSRDGEVYEAETETFLMRDNLFKIVKESSWYHEISDEMNRHPNTKQREE